ncbi:hypothetical protein ACLX1H_010337 [Fusarium chlamydosporum]
MNFVYALFIPLGVLIAFNIVTRAPAAKHEVTYLSFLISIVLTSFITDIIKNAVGRPRPDLLDRCQPAVGTKANTLVTIDVCTREDGHILQEGWRSFPSGHSSFSFAGLGFLSLFLAGQLHVFRYSAGGRDLSRALVCLLPLVGAGLIAISRCEDYRHDVYDVCVGSALGMSIAYWSYRRHWPRLSSQKCDEPYPRPGVDTQPGWQRITDDEEAARGTDVGFEMGNLREWPRIPFTPSIKNLLPCSLLFLGLLVLCQVVLLQQRRNLISAPQAVVDLAVLSLSYCRELN